MSPIVVAVRTVLNRYATFTGRASRAEYWWWVLAVLLTGLAVSIIDGAILAPLLGFGSFDADAGQPLSALVSLALLLPNLAVGPGGCTTPVGRVGGCWWGWSRSSAASS